MTRARVSSLSDGDTGAGVGAAGAACAYRARGGRVARVFNAIGVGRADRAARVGRGVQNSWCEPQPLFGNRSDPEVVGHPAKQRRDDVRVGIVWAH